MLKEKNSRSHSRRPLPNNLWSRKHHSVQLWSLPDLSRTFEHV
jgi:hypothetical protein